MRVLIICIAAVAICANVAAQEFSYGIRAGLNISTISRHFDNKQQSIADGGVITEDDFSHSDGSLRIFDTGLVFGTGVNFGDFYVGVKYELGLSNIVYNDIQDYGPSFKNRNLSINVGFDF